MLSVYLCGLGLWLACGLLLPASAVIAANATSMMLVAAAIVMNAAMAARPGRQ
jgi:hypothetical protein